ncbi:MAG: AAA family ATPase [Actinomycetes bacterium]
MPFQVVDGTLGFFDVSGYTRLTERLARLGPEGAEAITEIADMLFVGLITAARAQGGDVLQFSGDAILVHFTGDGHPVRAAHAAVAMQRFIRDHGSITSEIGRVRLRMSVGMHAGPATFARLGSRQCVVLALGEHISRALAAEKEAEATQVLVTPETAALLPAAWSRPTGTGMARLLRVPLDPGTDDGDFDGEVDPQIARACVPEPVRDLLAAGAIPGEHRQLSLAFVGVRDLDGRLANDGAVATVERLQALAVEIERVQDEYGLLWVGADALPGAADFVLVAGSPVAHEDDEDRLLVAAREILDADLGLDLAIGVNRGRNFTGDVGHPQRRTYSISGDATNLAARIMAHAAPGQLLVHAPLLQRVRGRVRTEPCAPFRAKGKAAPVETVDLIEIRSAADVADARATPMVGRDAEAAALLAALEAGEVIEVTGPAGIGKTRLVDEVVAARGGRVVRVTGEPYAKHRPLAAARKLVRRALMIDDDASPGAAGAALAARVAAHAARLGPWLPLLAEAIGATAGRTAEVDALGPDFVADRRDEVVAELLAASLDPGTTLVLDSFGGFDDASQSLARRLARQVGLGAPFGVVIAHRDECDLDDLDRRRLELAALGAAAARDLVIDLTDDAPIGEHVLERVLVLGAGNPFFLRGLAGAAQSGGALPETVERVVAAGIDAVPTRPRLLLREAAVLGRRVDLGLLADVIGDPGAAQEDAWVGTEEFVVVADGVAEFREPAFREIAYEGLSLTRRRALHAAVAHRLAGGATPDAALLAFHAVTGRALDLAWEWTRRALRDAVDRSAPVDGYALAVDAIGVADRIDRVDRSEVVALCEEAGDLAYRIGERDAAQRWFARAQRLTEDPSVERARVLRKRGEVTARGGALPQSLRWYRRAISTCARCADSPAKESEEIEAHLAYASTLHHQDRNRAALGVSLRVLERAEVIGGERAAQALLQAATMTAFLGHPDGEPYATRARTAMARSGDDFRRACLDLNLGVANMDADRPAPALDLFRSAAEAFGRCGDADGAALSIHNRGECLAGLGRYDEAVADFSDAQRRFRAIGSRDGLLLARSGLGRAAAWRRDSARALELLEDVLEGFRALGHASWAVDTELRIAEAHLLAGDDAAARVALDSARPRVDQLERTGMLPIWFARLDAALLARAGDVLRAAAAVRGTLSAAAAQGLPVEEVAAIDTLLALLGTDDEETQALRARRAVLAESVGIVRSLAVV